MIEATINKVWNQIRPSTFAWWKLVQSSSAEEGAPVGATSVQTYADGSKWTIKLLEMSVSDDNMHADLCEQNSHDR